VRNLVAGQEFQVVLVYFSVRFHTVNAVRFIDSKWQLSGDSDTGSIRRSAIM
jgi:hypothetical protein